MEMMVAIAVFSLVMVTAMSALLNVIDANNKARAIKTSINNVSFALEGISKDMRVGTEYACGNNNIIDNTPDCPTGGNIIRYRSIRADVESSGIKRKYAYFKFSNKQMYSCFQKGTNNCINDADFSPITSTEVEITKATFYVLGVTNSTAATNKTQPRMILTIRGVAGAKTKIQSTFDLQTTVSQRLRVKTI